MHHYVYKLEDELGAFYFGVRTSYVAPERDSYMGSGVWPTECRRGGVTLQKSIISTHPSREDACIAESEAINRYIGNEMLMNRYFGVQNHLLGPREPSSRSGFARLDESILNSAFWVTESTETRIVWIALLCLADHNGCISGSIPWLAKAAGVSVQCCTDAIERMKSTDPFETTRMTAITHIEDTGDGWKFPRFSEWK